MTTRDPVDGVFDSSLFASTRIEKVRRALELGPTYYLRDLPRYLRARREIGLDYWDWPALVNPLREFRRRVYTEFPLPPNYQTALLELSRAGARLAMPRIRLEALLGAWWQTRAVPGDVIECGAYEGSTSLLIALLGLHNGLEQRVHVLDTFAGSPQPSAFDGGHRAGEFRPADGRVEGLERAARALGVAARLDIHPGLFAATFEKLEATDPRFAFVHIDANLFEGTRDACAFALPRMNPGGIVVFDDYNGVCDLGARLAIDSCLGATRPRPLAWCSSYLRAPG